MNYINKPFTYITVNGLLSCDAGRKDKIAHPVTTPNWMCEAFTRGNYVELHYKATQTGKTQKGNPKFWVDFSGSKEVALQDLDIQGSETLYYFEDKSYLRTLTQLKRVNNRIVGSRDEYKTVPFSDAPQDVQQKLKAKRKQLVLDKLFDRKQEPVLKLDHQEEHFFLELKYGGCFDLYYESPYRLYETGYRVRIKSLMKEFYPAREGGYVGVIDSMSASTYYNISQREFEHHDVEGEFEFEYVEHTYNDGSPRQFPFKGSYVARGIKTTWITEYSFEIKPQFRGIFGPERDKISRKVPCSRIIQFNNTGS